MISVDEQYIQIFKKLQSEYEELEGLISSVEIMSDHKLYTHYVKRFKNLKDIGEKGKEFFKLKEDIEFLNKNDDEESKQFLAELNLEYEKLFKELKELYNQSTLKSEDIVKIEITSKQDAELKNIIFDIINNYSLKNNTEIEVIENGEESIKIKVKGEGIYNDLSCLNGKIKYVLRGTENSAVVVVIEDQEVNNEINENDLIIQTLKSGGAGGQHINKTESAVRIIHIPTGISVECQDERSQTRNKEKALTLLKEKITQNSLKNIKNNEEKQRKIIKNDIFSDTPSIIIDIDRNKVVATKTKKEYNLKEILNGEINLIAGDTKVNE